MSYIGNTSTTQAFTPAIDYFSGNASTTAFTLSRPIASVSQIQVVVNNVAQNPSSAYTVSGNTITFTSAPSAGTNNIYVYYTSPITQVIAPGQNTVYPSSLSTTNALYWDTSGNVGVGTTTPLNFGGANLQVQNSTVGSVVWSNGTYIGQLLASAAAEVTIGSRSNHPLRLSTNDTERMRIDTSGRVTLPYQPFFYAYSNAAQTGYNPQNQGDAPVIYNATTTNTGSHYNTTTGKFTAPVAGNYIFHASAYSAATTFGQNWLVVNGSRMISTDWVSGTASNMSMGFWLIRLAANDTVGFHAYNGAVTSATIATNIEHVYFKGYLLG